MSGLKGLRVALLVGVLGCGYSLGQAPAHKIAITIDDLPETDELAPGQTRLSIIQAIIKALQDGGAPRVYGFVNAQTLVDEPWLVNVLEAWRAAGFMLGNHTYTHFDPNTHPVAAYERDIERDEPVLQQLMATDDWHWFRFPYLHEGSTMARRNALRQYLTNHGYRIAQVTIDFHDYLWNEPYIRCATRRDSHGIAKLETMYLANAAEAIRVTRARSQALYGRDIPHVLLLHDGAIEPVMLGKLIALLKQDGFTLVTLDEAEQDPAYAADPGFASLYGGTLLEQMMFARGIKDGPIAATPEKKLDGMCRAARK